MLATSPREPGLERSAAEPSSNGGSVGEHKLVYVLPTYSARATDHFAHVGRLVERLSEHLTVALFVEHSDGVPNLAGLDDIYCARHAEGHLWRRFWETYRYARRMIARGYDRFF